MGERVLLVDDEEEFVRFLAYRLSSRGYKVEIAFSGESAVDKLQSSSYDVVVLDIALPGFDGIETLARALKIDQDLQVIILSGHANPQTAVAAAGLGAVEFLEKPIPFDVLLEKVVAAKEIKHQLSEQRYQTHSAEILARWGW